MSLWDNAGRCYLHLRDRCDECGHAPGADEVPAKVPVFKPEPESAAKTEDDVDTLTEDFVVSHTDAKRKSMKPSK